MDVGNIVVTAAKVALIVAVSVVFVTALTTFVSLIVSFSFPPVAGEVLGLASMYLPFNALAVFNAIFNIINAVLVFLTARKVYNLTISALDAI